MITYPQQQKFLSDLRVFISGSLSLNEIETSLKPDNSPVTHIDKAISNFCKTHPSCSGVFYSEEDHAELSYPAIVLDPIDGTKELIKKNGECVVSIAWMKNPREGQSLIYNPFTGFHLSTFDLPPWRPTLVEKPYLGFVSRSEASNMKGLKNFDHDLVTRGSIAFKLGLLAAGSCDFVISLKPKSIWDIAAGTILGWQRGMIFYSNGKIVSELNQKRYDPPLIWGKPKVVDEIKQYSFFP